MREQQFSSESGTKKAKCSTPCSNSKHLNQHQHCLAGNCPAKHQQASCILGSHVLGTNETRPPTPPLANQPSKPARPARPSVTCVQTPELTGGFSGGNNWARGGGEWGKESPGVQ
eukprot:972346-Pelagomonas_calceolata.AAC.1